MSPKDQGKGAESRRTADEGTPADRRERAVRLAENERYWLFVSRVIAFFWGGVLFSYDLVFATSDNWQVRIVLGIAAVAMMSPVIAASVATAIAPLRGGADE